MDWRGIAGASLFALALFALTLSIDDYFGRGVADALPFVAFMPWLVLILLVAIGDMQWRRRSSCLIAALLLAAVSEILFVRLLGGTATSAIVPLWMAGVGMVLGGMLDLVVQGARRLGGGWRLLGFALGAGLLLLPPVIPAFERLAVHPPRLSSPADRPTLRVLTGLPLFWDERVLGAAASPGPVIAKLADAYTLVPIDGLDRRSLVAARLLLVAQPRPLQPAEQVALDAWLRGGGKALILADPDLRWPSRLPVGDARRAPAQDMTGGLFGHWGLRLESTGGAGWIDIPWPHPLRVMVDGAGRFMRTTGTCVILADGLGADCRLGRGRALLFADADLLRGDLASHAGVAFDNSALLVSWLDTLRGAQLRDQARANAWIDSSASPGLAIAVALAIPMADLIAAILLRRRRFGR